MNPTGKIFCRKENESARVEAVHPERVPHRPGKFAERDSWLALKVQSPQHLQIMPMLTPLVVASMVVAACAIGYALYQKGALNGVKLGALRHLHARIGQLETEKTKQREGSTATP